MNDGDCHLKIDMASYSTLGTLLKSLDPKIIANLKSISSVAATTVTDTNKKNVFHKLNSNDVIMGLFVSQLTYSHSNSVRLTLEELSMDGKKGPEFFLTIYANFSAEWQKFQALAKHRPGMKAVFLFKNIQYQLKTNKEIQFHLTSFKLSPWIQVKSFSPTTSENYSYVALSSAAEQLEHKSNTYGVVHSILKEPETTSKGRAHSMYLLVDPSCYEGMMKTRDYRVHIFGSSVTAFPKINVGDVMRLHRVVTEVRPKDGLRDFRVYRESDVVIFPWDDNDDPRSVGWFTFTEVDAAQVKLLKTWSLERYRRPTTPSIPAEAKIITMNEIKPEEVFNLPCRLVEFFDEVEGVAMWVEDGTKCPLYTCSDSNIQPFDSQATQDICKECLRICVRCSKRILANLKLERQMLLYLKEVHPSTQNCVEGSCQAEDDVIVVQFEIKGAVEVLPQNTRYHKSLMQRLNKSPVQEPATHPIPQSNEKSCPQEELKTATPQQSEVSVRPKPSNEKSKDVKSTRKSSVVFEEVNRLSSSNGTNKVQSPVKPISVTDAVTVQNKSPSIPRDHIPSSGESSTDRAMIEIPSDCFSLTKSCIPQNLVREDIEREARRLHLLVHPEVNEHEDVYDPQSQLLRRPFTDFQQLGSLEEVSFSQVIASTQKPVAVETDESSFSQEIPNAQRLFSPGTEVESPKNQSGGSKFDSPTTEKSQSRSSVNCSASVSPHPKFRAVNEVLNIKTNYSVSADKTSDKNSDDENQLNVSIDAPLFRHRNDGDRVVNVELNVNQETDQEHRVLRSSVQSKKRSSNHNAVRTQFNGDDQREEIAFVTGKAIKRNISHVIEEVPAPKSRRVRMSSEDSSSSSSIVEIFQECSQDSQDSDKESIVVFDPLSQDLEKFFCAVESAGPQELYSMTNLDGEPNDQLGERFRITAQLNGILPQQLLTEDRPIELKHLLVAFCTECKHLWQYKHFIDSISMRVCKPRNPPKLPKKLVAQEEDGRVINYLCSEEEHDRNMRLLAESQYSNKDQLESDEKLFKDYSYYFICPLCKSRGIPDTLSQLQPSFFFWLHFSQQVGQVTNCFHVMASGVHAESFLGSKADHVLRSSEIWKRAEQRIAKLLQHQQPLTLSLRRISPPNCEVCLEHTHVVYSNDQLLNL